MKIVLVTDAWLPQVNGVVTTLVELVRELQAGGHAVEVIHPGLFRTWPCPGYPGIDLALWPGRALRERLDRAGADAIHIATEGPLGWAARRHCRRRQWSFTTAFHTKFPEILHAALGVPVRWGYALMRRFHAASSGVMVPTQGVLRMLRERGFRHLRAWTHGVDTRLFSYAAQARPYEPLGPLAHPVTLYVGRVSYEKSVDDFLALDVPGSKVVCGVGPLLDDYRQRHPNVHWLGLLPRHELARVYAAADVFVHPSRHETFGLVLLEAMAAGVPVAARPVDGPLEVLGESDAGALNDDLALAWQRALQVPRHRARARAECFSWGTAAQRFVEHLVPLRSVTVVGLSQKRHVRFE